MSELPRKAISRAARLASLPLGAASRATLDFGKRLGGQSSELVSAEAQRRTAEQVFKVLGELKGGAMKFGQTLSVLESALPEELIGPYRDTLTRLQEAAPPMPTSTVHEVLEENLGRHWQKLFVSFDDDPAAAASIGQVHRAVWHDGRDVAVKIQYPGADDALRSDLNQVSRLGRTIGSMFPGIDAKALVEELHDRMLEELDYRLEADAQEGFAHAYDGDDEFAVPRLVHGAQHVLVSEWLDGTPLSEIISTGTQEERDRVGLLYVRFLFSGPERAGLLHADPHPGNYRITPDGRLGVLDYGAVARFPEGLPSSIGRLIRRALDGETDEMLEGLREEGFVRPHIDVDPQGLYEYLAPFLEPARHETFHFNRAWMREQFNRINDPRRPGYTIGLKLNVPPAYLLVHRVWLGGIGVLSQLDCEGPFRAEFERWVPGFHS
ncbi:AarF/ABC1/UbiB kinase family protein [Actinobacteria bacterium YIM 96077]|uniref:AarF/ABC1/UbiB kinase family protein n=1 Tax=Phytoactinopolyspora halophila TaxID=1981511 RepID=A0A329R2L1_9ACTN|nr:AarF/ABC1/UbiB kinase family protein [Phytoactinopolyspora halophila]AYY11959.1 AarF/ABC1/UbiB kinase family protein [Actinobacteria bacterium YIM 96077]RAW18807.1 AarF/ABC1/UbiB kinase family protein [Phytoactinopolyspora halophila]